MSARCRGRDREERLVMPTYWRSLQDALKFKQQPDLWLSRAQYRPSANWWIALCRMCSSPGGEEGMLSFQPAMHCLKFGEHWQRRYSGWWICQPREQFTNNTFLQLGWWSVNPKNYVVLQKVSWGPEGGWELASKSHQSSAFYQWSIGYQWICDFSCPTSNGHCYTPNPLQTIVIKQPVRQFGIL